MSEQITTASELDAKAVTDDVARIARKISLGAALDALAMMLSEWERAMREAEARAERAALDGHVCGDEHHTMDELYEYRMLYNAHAAHGWLAAGIPVFKSLRHHDGEPCFGGGWFIVTAQLPTGQVSNHYDVEHWDLFQVPVVSRAPEWDGHTPQEAAQRLRDALLA